MLLWNRNALHGWVKRIIGRFVDDLGMSTCFHFVHVSSRYSFSFFLFNKFQLSVCMQHSASHKDFSLILSSNQVTHSAKMHEVTLTTAVSAIRRPSDLILVSERNNSRTNHLLLFSRMKQQNEMPLSCQTSRGVCDQSSPCALYRKCADSCALFHLVTNVLPC